MYKIIATSLFQNKICTLPGIGTLSVQTSPAQSDFVNGQIMAPVYTIEFKPEQDGNTSFNEFSAISQLLKKDIDNNKTVEITGVGVLSKNKSGKINFTSSALDKIFTQPVSVERVIRENAAHAMLVGDKETTNVVMTEYFAEEIVAKDYWWIWAIVLGVLGIAAIAFYFFQNGYHTGNGHILG